MLRALQQLRLNGMLRCGMSGIASSAAEQEGARPCFSSLPIVDVAALVQPNQAPEMQYEAAAALHEAAKDVGFCYIKSHGVPQQLCKQVLSLAQRWFDLPAEVKQQIALSPDRHFRGYQALGANVTRYDDGAAFSRDWHEGLDFYKEEQDGSSRLHGPNQWPSQLPEFEACLKEYVPHMLQLGETLMKGIGLGLGVPERLPGEPDALNSYWVMRVLSYPPLPAGGEREEGSIADRSHNIERSVQLSCGEHCDYGMLTFVNQPMGITALQVQNSAGQWIDAPPIEDTFVLNIGDMLTVMSNGIYKATPHRVINQHGEQTRTSAAFFYEPAFEAIVKPAESLSRDGRHFEEVRYGDHLESKVFSNFEF